MFPGNSPEANANAVNGYGPDGGPKLVNANSNPERPKSQAATDNWSYKDPFGTRRDTDILAMYDVTGLEATNRRADPDLQPRFANGNTATDGTHPLKKLLVDNARIVTAITPFTSNTARNSTRFMTNTQESDWDKFTTAPSIEDSGDVITLAGFTNPTS